MKRILYTILFLLLIVPNSNAQTDTLSPHNNAIYIEVIGIGGYWSINYERILYKKNSLKIRGRIGYSTLHLTDFTTSFNPDIVIPLSINATYGSKHHLELGVGQAISNIVQASKTDYEPERVTNFHANFTVGYRYQKKAKGFLYRINYTPLIEFYSNFKHWGGASIGYAF